MFIRISKADALIYVLAHKETLLNSSWAALAPQKVKVIGIVGLTNVWIDTFIGPVQIRYNYQTITSIGNDYSLFGKNTLKNPTSLYSRSLIIKVIRFNI
jgi:hypothetical protein